MSMMAFKADIDEETEIDTYRKARHFKDRPSFLRFAVFAYIRQNKPGGHRTVNNVKSNNEAGRGGPPLATTSSEGQS